MIAQWQRVARYGMTKIALTDHETGWRDGGESYNNYTDFAPVNEFWHEDMVSRLSDGQWRTAWPRCYNPKPARAVEYEARLAPIIQHKFQLDTAYCDVHTAVRPWSYCDFDARMPGGGTFAATFYAYGEIMLHQKATWNGPVYSEGNNHCYYCGLTIPRKRGPRRMRCWRRSAGSYTMTAKVICWRSARSLTATERTMSTRLRTCMPSRVDGSYGSTSWLATGR